MRVGVELRNHSMEEEVVNSVKLKVEIGEKYLISDGES